MEQFNAATFMDLTRALGAIHGMFNLRETGTIPESIRMLIKERLGVAEEDCAELGLVLSVKSIRRTLRLIESGEESGKELTTKDVTARFEDLTERLLDEMESILFFSLDSSKRRFYDEPQLFGEAVAQSFPSAADDIEEAGKCLALSRATACVFHLMRVMEHGLRAVGKSLNDPSIDPERNPTWKMVLTKFDSELQKSLANRSSEWMEDDAFFSGVAASLHAVKDAWRNPTMHVRISYTEEQALDVYNSVRGFMRHIAKKVAE